MSQSSKYMWPVPRFDSRRLIRDAEGAVDKRSVVCGSPHGITAAATPRQSAALASCSSFPSTRIWSGVGFAAVLVPARTAAAHSPLCPAFHTLIWQKRRESVGPRSCRRSDGKKSGDGKKYELRPPGTDRRHCRGTARWPECAAENYRLCVGVRLSLPQLPPCAFPTVTAGALGKNGVFWEGFSGSCQVLLSAT